MITKLTAAQESRLGEFAAKWTDIGLCTEPADRPRAESALRDAYALAGLAPPQRIVWCGSPLAAGLTRAIVLHCLGRAAAGENVAGSARRDIAVLAGDDVQRVVGNDVWPGVVSGIGSGRAERRRERQGQCPAPRRAERWRERRW